MSNQTNDKVRLLADGVTWTASVGFPPETPFPSTRDPDLFIGDFKGAEVQGMSWDFTKTGGAGTIDGLLRHSADGVNWYDVDATNAKFTQLADTGNEMVDLSGFELLRYLSVKTTLGTNLAGTLTIRIHFSQTGAKGRYAPPGYSTKPT